MDFFGGIRNFIGGLFGNNDEEERRRRQQQQQRSRPSTVTSRPLDRSEINFGPSIRTPQPFEIPGRERDEPAPSPLLNLGGVQTKPANPNNRTPEQLRELARHERDHQARMDKIKSDQFWGNIWEVPKATGTVGKAIAQGTARIPETVARTIAQPLGDNFGISTSQQEKNTGIRKFLYGEDPVQTYHDQARDIGQWAEDNPNPNIRRIAPVSPFIAPLLASLDIGTGGIATKAAQKSGQVIRRTLTDNPVAGVIDDTVASGTPPIRVADNAIPNRVVEAPEPNTPPRDPGSPITQSPTTNKPPAITSANPDYVPPQAPQPQPMPLPEPEPPRPIFNEPQPEVPLLQGVQPQPVIEPPVAPLVPDEQMLAAQRAIDEAAVRPPEPAPQPVAQLAETPLMAESRAIADETMPVNPEILAQQLSREAVRDAPTEAIARGIADDGPLRSDLVPEYLPGSPSKQLQPNSRVHKIDVPRMLRETGLTPAEIDSVMKSLFKNNKNVSHKRIRQAVDDLDNTPQAESRLAVSAKSSALPDIDKVNIGDTIVATDGKLYTSIDKPYWASGKNFILTTDNATRKMVTLKESDIASVQPKAKPVAQTKMADEDIAKRVTADAVSSIKKANSKAEVDRIYDRAQGQLSELDIDETLRKELADTQVLRRHELVDSGVEPSGVDPTRPHITPTETSAQQAARGQAEFDRRMGEVDLDADSEKRFIQLRDYNNSGDISPDELAEFERLTVDRMKRRGTYDNQVDEIVDAVNSGTATIEDVPSVLRKEVEARINPRTGGISDVVETPATPSPKPSTPKVPTLRAFGKEIPMTPKNGYKAVRAADGSMLYNKLGRVGSNRKGDRGFEDRWYDAQGNKLTKAQADAYIDGSLTKAPALRREYADVVKEVEDLRRVGKEIPDELKERVERIASEGMTEPRNLTRYDEVADNKAVAADSAKSRKKMDEIYARDEADSLAAFEKEKPVIEKKLVDFQNSTKDINYDSLSKQKQTKLNREGSEVMRQVRQLYHEAPNMDGGKVYKVDGGEPNTRYGTQGTPIKDSTGESYIYVTDLDGSDHFIAKTSSLKEVKNTEAPKAVDLDAEQARIADRKATRQQQRAEIDAQDVAETSSAKQKALDIIEGASSDADKLELYKTAKVRGLIETKDIPESFRKAVLADTTGPGTMPKAAREQMEVEDLLGDPKAKAKRIDEIIEEATETTDPKRLKELEDEFDRLSGAQNTADPRIAQADEKATKHIAAAKQAGVDYSKLVEKTYKNSVVDKTKKGVKEPLTEAEEKVWKTVKKDLDEVVRKLNEKGITDEDLGYIQGNYLPTAKKSDLGRVESVDDVASKDFGFSKTRSGTLTDKQVREGAEQALQDYLRVGALLDDMSPAQVDMIKEGSLTKQFTDMIEGEDKLIKLDDSTIAKARERSREVVRTERKVTEVGKKVSKGDKSEKTLSEYNQAVKEAHEAQLNKVVDDLITLQNKTKEAIKNIKNSSAYTPGQRRDAIEKLRKNLDTHEYRTRYLQSYTRSNALFQIPGRVADQANKASQAISNSTVGVLGRLAENKSFIKHVGRPVRADRGTTRQVMKGLKDDPRLNLFKQNLDINKKIADRRSKTIVGRVASRYRIYATAATEMGSSYRGPVRETVSYFVAKGQAEGLTKIDDLAKYVQDNVNSSEWKRVYGEFYRERNAFTGVPMYRRDLDGSIATPQSSMDKFFTGVDKLIERGVAKAGVTNPRAQREISDALRIPLIGFPRVLMNLGVKGFDHATLGVRDFVQAARITPVDEATSLRKALLLRSAVESAQTGAAVGAMGAMLGAAGMVSGAYPENASEKARWQKEGKQPFSVKMVGPDGEERWFDVSRYIGPFAFPFLIGAQMSNGGLTPGNTRDLVGNIAVQVSKNFGADSVADFLTLSSDLFSGDLESVGQKATRYLPNMIGMAIPAGGQLNATAKLFDEYQRETQGDSAIESVGKGIQRKIPGLRNQLEARTDAFGNPLKEDSVAAFLPTYGGGQDTSGPLETELSRLAEAGVEAYPTGVKGQSRDYKLEDVDGNDIKISRKQQVDLNNAVKKEKAEQADLVMTSEAYKKATDQEKGEMLKKLYNLDSSATAAEWASKNGVQGVKATSAKVNSSLPRTQKQALIEYRLQGDSKDKWLDDINNAADYYRADYENAKANDTLDYDDDNLYKKTSKKYRMIAAETNKEFGADRDLIALYENTTKKEFKNMPEGKLKERLRAFDLARAKKGVSLADSDHSQPRYGASGSGSGRGGRKGSGKFGFANLPASLVGTGSGQKSYAKNAPTFKPIADLQAPSEAKIPKGRAISVKKGIHL